MASFVYTEEEIPQFELLKAGYYPFEIVDFETTLGEGKTAGNDVLKLKLRFFSDTTFSKPVAQWTERLTLPRKPEEIYKKEDVDLNKFFQGNCNMFVRCCNIKATVGHDIELNQATCLGLRGIAYVTQRKIEKGPHAGEMTNYVKQWPTDKEKLEARVVGDTEVNKPF